MAFNSIDHVDVGQVIGYGPNRTLKVMLRSGQMISTPVQFGLDGMADSLCINQRPLPRIGTWGTIEFPYKDDRNGVWCKSFYIGSNSALVFTNQDPQIEYNSYPSGYYDYKDSQGNDIRFFADGTYVLVSSSQTPPAITQNTVQNGQIIVQPIDNSVRVSQNPFYYTLNHSSGTVVSIDPSGNTLVNLAANAQFEVNGNNGSFIIQLDGSGNITLQGKTVTAKTAAGNEAVLDSSGNIEMTAQQMTVTCPATTFSGNVVIDGTITAGGGAVTMSSSGMSTTGSISSSGDVVAGSISLINHLTTGVTPGSGTSGPPTE